MLIITVGKSKVDGLYYPETKADEQLMQHCVNTDLVALNEEGLEKAAFIAAAHDWRIEVK